MTWPLAVDFDNTLVEQGEPLRFRPGAFEALTAFARAGVRVVLHSCRCNPLDPGPEIADEVGRFYRTGELPERVTDQWVRFVAMRAFLQAAGVWDGLDVWQGAGKPLAARFIDDRAEPPDWAVLIREFVG
jgi:hypothetical protein